MKTIKKILTIIAIIIMIVGMFVLGRNGFNYVEGYSSEMLLETAKQYILYVSIATAIVLLYFAIKYSKNGKGKVLVTSILAILGTLVFTVAVIAIARMPVSRLFFPIVLAAYVSSLMMISANFEENI